MRRLLRRLAPETAGIGLLLLSILLATLEAVVVRVMADRVGVGQLLLIRSLAQMALAPATGLAAGAWFFGDAITVAMAMGVGLILIGAWYSRWP